MELQQLQLAHIVANPAFGVQLQVMQPAQGVPVQPPPPPPIFTVYTTAPSRGEGLIGAAQAPVQGVPVLGVPQHYAAASRTKGEL